MKITFFLMSSKGLSVLRSFVDSFGSDKIDCVIAARDGQVLEDSYDSIHDYCLLNNIQFFNRQDKFSVKTKWAFAISWRWLIEETGFKLIVLHDSLLPKYRGFSPLVNALLNEEEFVGVTALIAEKEYDKGVILSQESLRIQYPIKILNVIIAIEKLYNTLVIKVYRQILTESLEEAVQDDYNASYSLWRDEDDYKIDWSKSSSYIKRFIDSVGYPYKFAATTLDGKPIRILDAELVPDLKIEIRHHGKLIHLNNGNPVVVCGSGLLEITQANYEKENKSILPLKKFRIRFG